VNKKMKTVGDPGFWQTAAWLLA